MPIRLLALIRQAAVEGEVVQQTATNYGQLFKIDWTIPETGGLQLRTTWEIASAATNPRLITAFVKNR